MPSLRRHFSAFPCQRLLIYGCLALLICGILTPLLNARVAYAVQPQPLTDWSFYVDTLDASVATTLGCNQGHFDANNGNINSLVVLDFGAQTADGSGTEKVGSYPFFMSRSYIEQFAENFADAYYQCTGSDLTSMLWLAVGTNNSANTSGSNGSTWASIVNDISNYINSNKDHNQVYVGGASDMEQGAAWDGPTPTRAWADSYSSGTGQLYVDYGDAECPQYDTGTTNQGCGSNGWTQADVYYVAWQETPANNTPEIYLCCNETSWEYLSLWGVNNGHTKIQPEGPMDYNALNNSDYTAAQAWTNLWNALNNSTYPQIATNMTYSVEQHCATGVTDCVTNND